MRPSHYYFLSWLACWTFEENQQQLQSSLGHTWPGQVFLDPVLLLSAFVEALCSSMCHGKREKSLQCTESMMWTEKWGGCAFGGKALSQCLYPIEFHFQQCSGWWRNTTQALSFYSITELIQFISPKKTVQLLWKHLWLRPPQIVLTKQVFSEPDC